MTGSLENIFQLSKVARLGGGGGLGWARRAAVPPNFGQLRFFA